MKYEEVLNKDKRITILTLSWRDIKSPNAGGAEVHTHEMLKRLDKNKFRIIHLAGKYADEKDNEVIDGVNYIRKGSVFTVIWYAFLYYRKNCKNIDFVIDECNTHRFFTPLYVNKYKRIFYIHQLTREIWDINCKWPFNWIGKMLETPVLKLNKNDYVITVSQSTKNDLIALGYNADRIIIIPNGISFAPWKMEQMYEKEQEPTFIFVGRYSWYKGIDVAVEALGLLKKKYKKARLWILGKKDEDYIRNKLNPISDKYHMKWGEHNDIDVDIIAWGFVSEEKKLELLSRATALVFPSIREGWGIPITEAAIVGTPSIVFDAPGLRDAVNGGEAGYLCKFNNANGLKDMMEKVILDKTFYEKKRIDAYNFSKQFQWENTGKLLENFLLKINLKHRY